MLLSLFLSKNISIFFSSIRFCVKYFLFFCVNSIFREFLSPIFKASKLTSVNFSANNLSNNTKYSLIEFKFFTCSSLKIKLDSIICL